MINFLAAKVKAAALGVTDIELKVLEVGDLIIKDRFQIEQVTMLLGVPLTIYMELNIQATNAQAWGPHGTAMAGGEKTGLWTTENVCHLST